MTDEPDKPEMVKIQYVGMNLSSGREVRVGFNADKKEERSYYFKFMSELGKETRLRLSEEAYSAIIAVKPHVDMLKDTDDVMQWQVRVQSEAPEPDAQ